MSTSTATTAAQLELIKYVSQVTCSMTLLIFVQFFDSRRNTHQASLRNLQQASCQRVPPTLLWSNNLRELYVHVMDDLSYWYWHLNQANLLCPPLVLYVNILQSLQRTANPTRLFEQRLKFSYVPKKRSGKLCGKRKSKTHLPRLLSK
jgi:hypothetical protein